MTKNKKGKSKLRKIRDLFAISAWWRRSGPLKNKKYSIKKQRQWKQRQNKDD